jgi:D-glycero-D-manno-heptose 1,7-bisphosphate phosphatase
MIKIIAIDRDGVINEDSPDFIKSPTEWHPIPGSLEAIAKLNQAGFKVVVATNQSGIARKLFTAQALENIHQKMRQELAARGGHLDGIFICPHAPEDNCSCRKPKPGLLLQIISQFHIEPKEMITIGDSMRDVLAARAADCEMVLVKTGNGEHTIAEVGIENLKDVKIFADLKEAAATILKENGT